MLFIELRLVRFVLFWGSENFVSLFSFVQTKKIIHRPSSAVKELLENSLDAGSSSLTIVLKVKNQLKFSNQFEKGGFFFVFKQEF